MLGTAQEGVRLLLEVVDADAGVGGEYSVHQCAHIGVVTRVVLGHQGTEPAEVSLGDGLPRLTLA